MIAIPPGTPSAMSQPPDDPTPQAYVPERPSKTQRKQKAHDLQSLGQDLVELPASRLVGLEMPEILRDAIAQYKRTRSFEGQRRQLQYIGKQMRFADEAPLREAVAAYKLGSAKDTLKLHESERWRDELVADDDAATRWVAEFPGSDLQRLRSLIRAARKDAAAAPEQRNGRGYRELFQFIKPWLGGHAGAAHEQDFDADEEGEPGDD